MAQHKNGGLKDCHQLNTMDNAAFEREPASGATNALPAHSTVEMGEFCSPGVAQAGKMIPTEPSAPLCRPDICRTVHSPPASKSPLPVKKIGMESGSPWHRYKTIFLVGTVAGLIIWAVAYLVLESFDLL